MSVEVVVRVQVVFASLAFVSSVFVAWFVEFVSLGLLVKFFVVVS
jgi:hypothetical protein